MNLLLEPGNLDGLVTLIGLIMIGPAALLFIIAIVLIIKKKKKGATILGILGVVYLIISFGICGVILTSN